MTYFDVMRLCLAAFICGWMTFLKADFLIPEATILQVILRKHNSNNNVANVFTERLVNVWNRPPMGIVKFDNLSKFN